MYLYMGLLGVIPGIIYFTFFVNRFFRTVLNIHTNNLMIFVIGLIVMVISVPAMNTLELYGVIYYHLLAITVILEIINMFLKRFRLYHFMFISGILSIVILALVLGFGYYNIKHVVKSEYSLESSKLDHYKILEIADLHMSTSMNEEELEHYCQEMSQEDVDIVVLTGDIFDENTPLADMIAASKILTSINNKEGIYYVYGNHDNGRYGGVNSPFGPEEIRQNLEANGIVVLDDQVVSLDKINIIGRKDASFWGNSTRFASSELLAMIPEDKQTNYNLLLDHQPLDLQENAKLGIDLQLSGHTHGGQLFPMGIIQSLTSDTLVVGKRTIGDFTAITTSGMAGWRYPLKTGAKSEYVVIEIK